MRARPKQFFFGSKKGVKSIISIDLTGIDTGTGVLIPFSSEVVSLDITLDSKLTWNVLIIIIPNLVHLFLAYDTTGPILLLSQPIL